jgi:molecular chaperone DnaK
VLQGERPLAKDNRSLARFELYGIPPAPRGVPQIEVAFEIDADGILHVSAKDLAIAKEQKIRVHASSGLTEEEIQKMVKEAESHAEEDRRKRELIDLRNQADGFIYTVEKTLKDIGSKIPADKQENIKKAIDELRKVMNSENPQEIKDKLQLLQDAWYKATEDIYGRPGTPGYTGPETKEAPSGTQESKEKGEGDKKDKAVDADYEVVE